MRYRFDHESLTEADRELRQAVRQGRAPHGQMMMPLLRAGHWVQLLPTEEMIEAAAEAIDDLPGTHGEHSTPADCAQAALEALRDYFFVESE